MGRLPSARESDMAVDRSSRPRVFGDTRDCWPLMTAYERFEHLVALTLSLVIAVVILIALVQLV
jgi:hypothetical protein